MRSIAVALALLALTGPMLPAQDGDPLATVREVLTVTPLFDGHNDLPWAMLDYDLEMTIYDLRERTPGHTDIDRLREGMVGAQFWSVGVPSDTADPSRATKLLLQQIDLARRMLELYPDVFEQAYSASDVDRIFGRGRIASALGIEGGHAIANSLGVLRAFYRLGARYMSLTHFSHTDWADSGTEEPVHGGLTAFGVEVVREMNRIGMLVDLSHASVETTHDALDASEAPVIFSHSSARALVDHRRNVPDDVLRRMRDNGGIVMVTFVGSHVNQETLDFGRKIDYWALSSEERARVLRMTPKATLRDVADHIEHVREVAGIDHVGIGSDFDGTPIPPRGLEDVSKFPALLAELVRRGWTTEELAKVAGENVLRVWREAEKVARRLQRERRPSMATIEELDG